MPCCLRMVRVLCIFGGGHIDVTTLRNMYRMNDDSRMHTLRDKLVSQVATRT